MSVTKGVEVARGKTKILYEMPNDPRQLVVQQMDTISAGDGARRDTIAGKGRLAALTTSRVFRLLNREGLPTHYVSGGEDADANEMIVTRCTMIPLEVVARGVVAGSYAKRNPDVRRGATLDPLVVEFFLKDDAHHDPMISEEEIVARNIATPAEVERMRALVQSVFAVLQRAWQVRDVTLVDLKVEFGRPAQGDLLIADVIDNDSWRIWPHGSEAEMLDKQIYRNLEQRDAEALARVKRAYEEVAAAVAEFAAP